MLVVKNKQDRLDILVSNAGIGSSGGMEETSLDDCRRIMAVDLEGAFLGTKYAIELMRDQNYGTIVNISFHQQLALQVSQSTHTIEVKRG